MFFRHLFTVVVLLIVFSATGTATSAPAVSPPGLTVIEQDYEAARRAATKENKIIFVDFYTTWCGPCKQLDKYVFKSDSMAAVLGRDVVLLKYDAERDTAFHLSKKYHVSSYPTGLLLTPEGDVLIRSGAFQGDDTKSMGESVSNFVADGKRLRRAGTTIPGYTQDIDPTIYPKFYTDFVNRTNIKIDSAEINDYFIGADDKLSEAFASVLFYFASEANEQITSAVLKDRAAYAARYGEIRMRTFAYMVVRSKFNRAVKAQDEAAFAVATNFAKEQLGEAEAEELAESYRLDILKAQGRWGEVIGAYQAMKDRGEIDNGYLNHISWQVYKECEDPAVIDHCLGWMKEVTAAEPAFDYLDTYARMLLKAKGKVAARPVIEAAIKAGKEDGRKTESLTKLLE